MDVRLQAPFSLLCCGPSGCGKTQWTKKLLENSLNVMSHQPDRIAWCYGEWQDGYRELSEQFPLIEFIEGIPSNVFDMFDPKMNNMIIIDDLMAEAAGDKKIANLFTKGSHHRNLSVIFILQNLFYQGKESRTISLNNVLFKILGIDPKLFIWRNKCFRGILSTCKKPTPMQHQRLTDICSSILNQIVPMI